MPRRRVRNQYNQLSDFKRGGIIDLCETGLSTREISARVGRDARTVGRCCQQWLQEGTHTRRAGSGSSRITSEREDRRIRRMALANRYIISSQISSVINSDFTHRISNSTITRRLMEAGLRSRVPLRRLPLTQHHRQQRLQ